MPKLKTGKPEFDAVGRLLRGYGVNGANLSKVLSCAPATARKKLAEPKHFTLGDLDMTAQHFGIPVDELRGAFQK